MIDFGWSMTRMGVEALKMLEATVLSQFNFIENGESIFSSQILSLLKSQSCGLRGERIGGTFLVIKVRPRPF